jgi:hypothetical protein
MELDKKLWQKYQFGDESTRRLWGAGGFPEYSRLAELGDQELQDRFFELWEEAIRQGRDPAAQPWDRNILAIKIEFGRRLRDEQLALSEKHDADDPRWEKAVSDAKASTQEYFTKNPGKKSPPMDLMRKTILRYYPEFIDDKVKLERKTGALRARINRKELYKKTKRMRAYKPVPIR